MTINPGMLLFCIVDSCIAFFFVYFITRSKFGGVKKTLARIIASILATLVFIVYFAVLIWFNTAHRTVSQAAQNVVYAAPIVLSILMIVLTILSQPPKKEEITEETGESEEEAETTASDETPVS